MSESVPEKIFREFIEKKHSYPNAAIMTLGSLITGNTSDEMNEFFCQPSHRDRDHPEDSAWVAIGDAIEKLPKENLMKNYYLELKSKELRDFEAVPLCIGNYLVNLEISYRSHH